jgi:excisionase family DNA binding protein
MAADTTDLAVPAGRIDDVADLCRVSVRTAWRLVERGDIPYYRLGAQVRFDLAEVAAAIRATRTTRTPA